MRKRWQMRSLPGGDIITMNDAGPAAEAGAPHRSIRPPLPGVAGQSFLVAREKHARIKSAHDEPEGAHLRAEWPS
jgi:hypothetical protein